MALTRDQIEDYVWRNSELIDVHSIGEYEIVEYWQAPADNAKDRFRYRMFGGFICGKRSGSVFPSLDECLVNLIAVKHDGINTRADGYFIRGIGAQSVPQAEEEAA